MRNVDDTFPRAPGKLLLRLGNECIFERAGLWRAMDRRQLGAGVEKLTNGPDFDAASANYEFAELLECAEVPA